MPQRSMFLLLALACLPALPVEASNNGVRDSIVKIYTIFNRPDYYNPWSMRGPRSGTGSGCVIEGKKILTNAHVISDQTFIQVRRYGEAKRYQARVLEVSHETDLAILTVDDESFFDGVQALTFGELPEGQQEVLVYGFPLGGDTLSITKGVVSRIEHQTYAHSSGRFLAGQIDAAINPGNSGGPVLVDDKIVGVVMQSISQADNIGYMVPVTIINHFMADLEDGERDGFPSLGVMLQNLENPDLKIRYGVPTDEAGMLIIRVLPGSPAAGALREGDVVLSMDGYDIEDDGTVEFRPRERTSVSYVVQLHQVGEPLDLQVYRDGEVQSISVHLDRSHDEDFLVQMESFDRMPTYYIYGGVVFCPLTKNLLKAWGGSWYNTAPKDLVARLTRNFQEEEGEEIVVMLKVLAADVNQGYHTFSNWIVDKVNGQDVKNLKQVVDAIENGTDDPYLEIQNEIGQQIILDRAKADATHEEILQRYRIPKDRSDDLDL